MREAGKWFPRTACHGRHSHRGRGSLLPVGSRRTRTGAEDRSTAHVYHRKSKQDVSTSRRCSCARRSCTDLYGRLELEKNGLRDENLASLGAEVPNLRLQQLHLLAGPAATNLQQSVYDGVQIHLVFRHSCDLLLARVW
jgi:hypothetical protein